MSATTTTGTLALTALALLVPPEAQWLPGPEPLPPPPAVAAADDFRWTGRIPAGKALEIRGVNGEIDAMPATGAEAEVVAVKKSRRSDPAEVTIQVVEHADGVTICAVYPPGRKGLANECAPGGGGRMETNDNDVSVRFTVRVPAGVRLVARTVNGDVSAKGLAARVEATTVNGDVQVGTSADAEASTVNGSIQAAIGRGKWQGSAAFHTVNGGITLEAPAGLSAEVTAETINGTITSDFPLLVQGRFGPRRLTGRIGDGGGTLSLKTVNGSIRLASR